MEAANERTVSPERSLVLAWTPVPCRSRGQCPLSCSSFTGALLDSSISWIMKSNLLAKNSQVRIFLSSRVLKSWRRLLRM